MRADLRRGLRGSVRPTSSSRTATGSPSCRARRVRCRGGRSRPSRPTVRTRRSWIRTRAPRCPTGAPAGCSDAPRPPGHRPPAVRGGRRHRNPARPMPGVRSVGRSDRPAASTLDNLVKVRGTLLNPTCSSRHPARSAARRVPVAVVQPSPGEMRADDVLRSASRLLATATALSRTWSGTEACEVRPEVIVLRRRLRPADRTGKVPAVVDERPTPED